MLTGMLVMTLAAGSYAIAVALARVRAIILEREAARAWVRELAGGANALDGEFLAHGRLRVLHLEARTAWSRSASSPKSLAARAPRARCTRRPRRTATRHSSPELGGQRDENRMKPKRTHRSGSAPALAVLGVAAALVLNAFQSQSRVLLHADAGRGEGSAAGPAVSHRRTGRGRQPASAIPNGLTVHFHRDRHRASAFRSCTPASCPTCSRKARASSRRARSAPTACSTPPKCSPSTTRTTCRPRPRPRIEQASTRARRMSMTGSLQGTSQMIPELGHFALILALLRRAGAGRRCRSSAPQRRDAALMALARPAARAQFVFVAFAFGCLAYSFVASDFSVAERRRALEFAAADRTTASPRRGARTKARCCCGLLMLAGWTFAVTLRSRNLPDGRCVARVLAVMGLVARRLPAVHAVHVESVRAPDARPRRKARDLNPLLQDPGMVIHPPMLYMGYVGFSVAFAFAVAALIGGRLDATWARWSRPWTTAAWCFLTIGIALGSWLGVLRTGLGRLVVLGPGRERVVHAVAGRHRADPFAGRHRKARHVQELDGAARDRRVLAVAARHVPGALRRADVGACVRHRSRRAACSSWPFSRS